MNSNISECINSKIVKIIQYQ